MFLYVERSSFELKLMSCNKCRQGLRSPGDTWCLGCRALEMAQLELGRRWPDQGARSLAEEILLSATRHVKRLGELGPGLITEQARYQLDFEPGAARNPTAAAPPARADPPGPAGEVGRRAEAVAGPTPGPAAPAAAPVVEPGAGVREPGPALEEDEYTYESFSEEVKAEDPGPDLGTAAKSSAPPPEPVVRAPDLVLREAPRKRELEVEELRGAGSSKKKNKKKEGQAPPKRAQAPKDDSEARGGAEPPKAVPGRFGLPEETALEGSAGVMSGESAPYGEEAGEGEREEEAGEEGDVASLGLPYSWESPGSWASLELQEGAVIEALLEPLPWSPSSDCGFGISARLGERLYTAQYLGTNDREPPKRRRRLFNVRGGRVHLCLTGRRLCEVHWEEGVVRVDELVLYPPLSYKGALCTVHGLRALKALNAAFTAKLGASEEPAGKAPASPRLGFLRRPGGFEEPGWAGTAQTMPGSILRAGRFRQAKERLEAEKEPPPLRMERLSKSGTKNVPGRAWRRSKKPHASQAPSEPKELTPWPAACFLTRRRASPAQDPGTGSQPTDRGAAAAGGTFLLLGLLLLLGSFPPALPFLSPRRALVVKSEVVDLDSLSKPGRTSEKATFGDRIVARNLERKRSGSEETLRRKKKKGKKKKKKKKKRQGGSDGESLLKPILKDEQHELGRTGVGPPDPQEGGEEAGGGHGGAPGPREGAALRAGGRARGRELEAGRRGEADSILPAVLEGEVRQQTSRPSRVVFAGPLLRLTAARKDQRSGRCSRAAHHGLRGLCLQRKLEYCEVSGSGNVGLRQPRSPRNASCCSKTCPSRCQIRAGLDFVERQRQGVRGPRVLGDPVERKRKNKRKAQSSGVVLKAQITSAPAGRAQLYSLALEGS